MNWLSVLSAATLPAHVLAVVNSFCAVNVAVLFWGCGTAHGEHSAWRWSVWAALGPYFTLVMNPYA